MCGETSKRLRPEAFVRAKKRSEHSHVLISHLCPCEAFCPTLAGTSLHMTILCMFIGRFAEVSEAPNPLGYWGSCGIFDASTWECRSDSFTWAQRLLICGFERYTAKGSFPETMELRVQ